MPSAVEGMETVQRIITNTVGFLDRHSGAICVTTMVTLQMLTYADETDSDEEEFFNHTVQKQDSILKIINESQKKSAQVQNFLVEEISGFEQDTSPASVWLIWDFLFNK